MPSNSIAHRIPTSFDITFQRYYAVEAPDLRRLYENAKRDQWNASTDVDWTIRGRPRARYLCRRTGRRPRHSHARPARAARVPAPQRRIFMLAALATAPRRGRRDARVQPAGRHGAGQRREVLPGDAGRRRSASRRSAQPLPAREVRRQDLSDDRQYQDALRLHPRQRQMVHQNRRPATCWPRRSPCRCSGC